MDQRILQKRESFEQGLREYAAIEKIPLDIHRSRFSERPGGFTFLLTSRDKKIGPFLLTYHKLLTSEDTDLNSLAKEMIFNFHL
jgi:hypothetical protein